LAKRGTAPEPASKGESVTFMPGRRGIPMGNWACTKDEDAANSAAAASSELRSFEFMCASD
jgi:hypothetical protein